MGLIENWVNGENLILLHFQFELTALQPYDVWVHMSMEGPWKLPFYETSDPLCVWWPEGLVPKAYKVVIIVEEFLTGL
jgi:hypothetical protein